MADKIKKTFLGTIQCPECRIDINIFKQTEVIAPAVPADKEECLIAEHLKGKQTTLDEKKKE